MTVSLYVSNPFKSTRLQVNNINLQSTISGFKHIITDTVGIHSDKQELIYNGGCLEDDQRSLQSYGVDDNVTIFVFEKVEDEDKPGDDTAMTSDELQAILSKARNPLYKQSVKKLVKNEEALKKVIKPITSLEKDTVTSALVRDPDLLLNVIETGIPDKIIENYPTLCTVLKSIVANSSMDLSSRQHLFQDDDENDFMGIDPSYLAQAELLAANEEGMNAQPSTSQQSGGTPSSSQQNRHQISASDLANALSFASMAQTASVPASGSTGGESTTNENPEDQAAIDAAITESALEQMRAMGITDDDLSRRALSMSGGVVEAALNLIFEGTLT